MTTCKKCGKNIPLRECYRCGSDSIKHEYIQVGLGAVPVQTCTACGECVKGNEEAFFHNYDLCKICRQKTESIEMSKTKVYNMIVFYHDENGNKIEATIPQQRCDNCEGEDLQYIEPDYYRASVACFCCNFQKWIEFDRNGETVSPLG